MKNNSKVIVILIISILIFIVYKYSLFSKYNISKKEQELINNLSDKIYIKDITTLFNEKVDNYYVFKNMKLLNVVEDYNCIEEKSSVYCTKDDVKISFHKEKTLLEQFKKYKLKNISTNKILKENNIKDDINLLGLIKETKKFNKYLKSNKEIKNNYILVKFGLEKINDFESIELINYKYNGYIYNIDKNNKKVILTKGKYNYIIEITNTNSFTNGKINEIIKSIEID